MREPWSRHQLPLGLQCSNDQSPIQAAIQYQDYIQVAERRCLLLADKSVFQEKRRRKFIFKTRAFMFVIITMTVLLTFVFMNSKNSFRNAIFFPLIIEYKNLFSLPCHQSKLATNPTKNKCCHLHRGFVYRNMIRSTTKLTWPWERNKK